MRRTLALPCALWISACYSPNAQVTTGNDDDEGSSSGSTASTDPTSTTATMTSTTTTADTSSGSTNEDSSSDITHGDTDEGDEPPEIIDFTVQGSQMPAEILSADTVLLIALVSDDVSVDRVEFYDGDELVATDDEAPYRVEFLVTSADNGAHSYTVTAYDSIEQTAEAGPIPLSVGIDGGAVIELREDIFRATVSLGLNSPYLIGDDSGATVIGTTQYIGNGFSAYRISAARYNLGLSQTWVSNYPPTVVAITPDYYSFGRGGLEEDGSLLIPSNLGVPVTEAPVRILRADASNDGVFSLALALPQESAGTLAGLAVLSDFDVTLGSRVFELSRYSASLDAPSWTEDISSGLGEGFALRLHADSTGAVLVDGISDDESFLRKVSPDGAILWTRESDETTTSTEIGFSAVGPGDQVTQVVLRAADSSLGMRALTYDTDGVLLHDVILAENEQMIVHDVAYDPSGSIVVAATHVPQDGVTNAWFGRFEPDGTEIWTTTGFVDDGDEEGYAVHTRADGRVFVSGIANVDPEFLAINGDVWIAELSL